MADILLEWRGPFDYGPQVTPDASEVSRSWVLNDAGEGGLFLPDSTPNLSQIIKWGNLLRIYETGVPTWAGIALERSWESGGVRLSLKSAEALLQKKVSRQGLIFGQIAAVSAGEIAREVFRSAYQSNNPFPTLKAGTFDATKTHFKQYDYVDCFETLQKLAEEDGAAFWVDPDSLAVNFRDQRGSDTSVVLYENRHLFDVKIIEQATDIVTAVLALGEGNDIPSKPKISMQWWSAADYFAAEVLNVNGATYPEALIEPAKEYIRQRALPRTVIDASFAKVDATWGAFGVGDTIEIITTRAYETFFVHGNSARVKVLALEKGEADTYRCVFEFIPWQSINQFTGWQLN